MGRRQIKYIAIHPDADGNTVSFLDDEVLKDLLNGNCLGRDLNFLSFEDLETKGLEPQYWSYYNPEIDILLIKYFRNAFNPTLSHFIFNSIQI